MDTPVEEGLSMEMVMKRGALVCVVALGGVAVGLAVWALHEAMLAIQRVSFSRRAGSNCGRLTLQRARVIWSESGVMTPERTSGMAGASWGNGVALLENSSGLATSEASDHMK